MGTTVKKHEIDMLHGSIWNKLPLFALPVAATAILEQLFHASDVAIVGNFTGDARTVAVAAVGANGPIIGLIVNLFIGIALGANVVIANAIGCRDDNAVKRAVHTAIVFAVCGGAAVALLGQLIASPLLSILNVPEDVFPYALLYLRIYLLGMPVILLYNFEAAIFRSIGDTKVPLAALAISGVLNVLLNLFFVIVLHMTVNGVAIATVAANAVSAALLYVRLTRTDKCVRVERKALRIDGASLKRILSIGLPAGVQSAVFSFANIVIQSASTPSARWRSRHRARRSMWKFSPTTCSTRFRRPARPLSARTTAQGRSSAARRRCSSAFWREPSRHLSRSLSCC